MTWAPWHVLKTWAPFKIDALGLVTLLGAEEVDDAIGRLAQSTYLEYMPLLGAFVIAGDRFREKKPSFSLYNISEGIHTTDLSPWLTRWMTSQDFETTRSFVRWTVTPPRPHRRRTLIAALLSFIFNGFLIALTILSKDWYGLANGLAMVTSILVRAYVIKANRDGIDLMIDESIDQGVEIGMTKFDDGDGSYEADQHRRRYKIKLELEKSKKRRLIAEEKKRLTKRLAKRKFMTERPVKDEQEWRGSREIKVLIVQSDSKAVTFWMPNELILPPSVFVERPEIPRPKIYNAVRWVGWLAFAVHIVAIGMADLASQLYTVVLLVLPTMLLVFKFGCDDSTWNSTIQEFFSNRCRCRRGDYNKEQGRHGPEDFRELRKCWFGSRLKAEVFEWPESYEFTPDKDGNWSSGPLPEGNERSKKRQDLYAWLALSRDEEKSMSKWDLFPHIRKVDDKWWQTYQLKKQALRRNPHFGPQLQPDTDEGHSLDPSEAASLTSREWGQQPDRTRTQKSEVHVISSALTTGRTTTTPTEAPVAISVDELATKEQGTGDPGTGGDQSDLDTDIAGDAQAVDPTS